MSKKRPKPEEIVAKLRQADILVGQGHSVAEAKRDAILARPLTITAASA